MKLIKVGILGTSNVGKSTICRILNGEQFIQVELTIGYNAKTIEKIVDEQKFKFQITDTGGQQRFRAVCSNQVRGSDIILLVYDCSVDADSNQIQNWIDNVNQLVSHPNVIVIGNKADKQYNNSCLTSFQKETIEDLKWRKIKISCKGGHNISGLWNLIIQMARKVKHTKIDDNHFTLQQKKDSESNQKKNIGSNQKKGWCYR